MMDWEREIASEAEIAAEQGWDYPDPATEARYAEEDAAIEDGHQIVRGGNLTGHVVHAPGCTGCEEGEDRQGGGMNGPVCDAYHGGVVPPAADVDFKRRRLLAGIPGEVRYLCDHHARGFKGWRDPKFRLTPMREVDA